MGESVGEFKGQSVENWELNYRECPWGIWGYVEGASSIKFTASDTTCCVRSIDGIGIGTGISIVHLNDVECLGLRVQ